MSRKDNSELFGALVAQGLGMNASPPEDAAPPGPRKPAPVPEVGRGGVAPGTREANAQYEFEVTMARALNSRLF